MCVKQLSVSLSAINCDFFYESRRRFHRSRHPSMVKIILSKYLQFIVLSKSISRNNDITLQTVAVLSHLSFRLCGQLAETEEDMSHVPITYR